MRREQLEHLLRAAGALTQETAIVVIGSQSILGAHPNASAELIESREADMYPKFDPSKGEILDAIGEDSAFDQTFGYYAQWVDDTTAVLPKGWKGRLVKIHNANTGGVTGYCLDPLDLVASKLAAGRPKDWSFVSAFLRQRLGTVDEVVARVKLLDHRSPFHQSEAHILAWLEGWRAQNLLPPKKGPAP